LPLGKNYNLCIVFFFPYIITIYAVLGGLGKSIHRSVHFKTLARQNGFRVWSINWKDGKDNWKSRKVLIEGDRRLFLQGVRMVYEVFALIPR